MSLAHLYHVPYSGNIERVSEDQAKRLSVPEDAHVARIYAVQTARLGHMIDYARGPAVAGGLLVRCPADEVQSVYDVVFGSGNSAKKSNIIEFPQQNNSFLTDVFANSADRFKICSKFANAVGTVRADNENHIAPNPDQWVFEKVA